MIKRIQVNNFMAHTSTVIEPAGCLTVLTGPNNSGKSALVSALQVLCTNEKGTYMVRHGESEASVSIEDGDDQIVEWRRKKSGAVTYVINGREVHRNVPDDLHQVLRMPKVSMKDSLDEFDVHFGEQKTPIFLIDQSGRYAATFFASSSDAEYMMRMQALHKARTATAKQDERRLMDSIALISKKVELLAPGVLLADEVKDVEAKYVEIKEAQSLQSELVNYLVDRDATERDLSRTAEYHGPLLNLRAAPVLQDTSAIMGCLAEILRADEEFLPASGQFATLSTIPEAPAIQDTAPITGIIARLSQESSAVACFIASVEASDALVIPPELHAESELHEYLIEVEQLAERERYLREVLTELSRVCDIPTTEDELGLRDLIRGIELVFTTAGQSQALFTNLSNISEPPIELASSTVAQCIADFVESLKDVQFSSACLAAVESLTVMSELHAEHELRSFVGDFQEVISGHGRCERILEEVESGLHRVRTKLNEWMGENPSCPVCGQDINPTKLMAAVEAASG